MTKQNDRYLGISLALFAHSSTGDNNNNKKKKDYICIITTGKKACLQALAPRCGSALEGRSRLIGAVSFVAFYCSASYPVCHHARKRKKGFHWISNSGGGLGTQLASLGLETFHLALAFVSILLAAIIICCNSSSDSPGAWRSLTVKRFRVYSLEQPATPLRQFLLIFHL